MSASNAAGSSQQMLLLTSNYAAGYKVDKVLGMVYGITVGREGSEETSWPACGPSQAERSRSTRSWPSRLGRKRSTGSLSTRKSMGANAVLSVMFDSTEMAASMEEIIAFGTAVVVSPVSGDQQLVKLS